MPVDISSTILTGGSTLSISKGAASWLTVNSNGVIARGQTPYMRGQLSGQGNATYSSCYNTSATGGYVTLGTVDDNPGGFWNNANGVWTCPVAGLYFAQMGGIAGGTALGAVSYGYPQILRNGAVIHFNHFNHASYWEYANLSAVVNCAAGDTLSFQISLGSGTAGGFYGGSGHGCFSIGMLM